MLPILQTLNAEARAAVGHTWAHRASSKAVASLRLAALSNALRAHQAPQDTVSVCHRSAIEAQKHAQACLKIAESFGQTVDIESVQRPGPLAPATLTIEHRILYELVAISCIQETLSGAVMGQVYQQAQYPPVKLTAHVIFKEGIWHSRLGWDFLGKVSQEGPITWLSVHLIELLELTADHELRRGVLSGPDQPEKAAYGQLSTAAAHRIFKDVINQVVLPGFESFGIDIEQGRMWFRAWAEENSP
ncbi:MAG: hypothetical protein VX589_09375 [Myxococcota bacterium]|nr:hypothetical protein [Myxococcota bacterium]